MAKALYYDSVDLLDSTLTDGNFTAPGFSSSNTLINEERAIDQRTSLDVTGWGTNESLQVNLGSAKAVDFVAVNCNTTESDDLILYGETSSSGASNNVAEFTSLGAGWQVLTFSEASKQYWVLRSETGILSGITEIILGKKLEFEMNPDIGISEQEIFGTDIQTSIGGVEYGFKRHEPKSTFSLTFSNISETFKNNLQSFEADVQNFKKFLYSEDGTTGPFYYVRLDSPIQFAEVAFERFSATINLREQLS
jgi:hypothetical protein